jgi:hypothetical protein
MVRVNCGAFPSSFIKTPVGRLQRDRYAVVTVDSGCLRPPLWFGGARAHPRSKRLLRAQIPGSQPELAAFFNSVWALVSATQYFKGDGNQHISANARFCVSGALPRVGVLARAHRRRPSDGVRSALRDAGAARGRNRPYRDRRAQGVRAAEGGPVSDDSAAERDGYWSTICDRTRWPMGRAVPATTAHATRKSACDLWLHYRLHIPARGCRCNGACVWTRTGFRCYCTRLHDGIIMPCCFQGCRADHNLADPGWRR